MLEKNLVFLFPISNNIQELKAEIEEKHTEDYTIYEMDDPNEFGQLVGILEHAVIFSSDLKKSARVLQENKDFLSIPELRYIISHDERIPPDAHVKLNKYGLKDVIKTSVPFKTLMSKVSNHFKPFEAKIEKEREEKEKSVVEENIKLKGNVKDRIIANTERIEVKQSETNLSFKKEGEKKGTSKDKKKVNLSGVIGAHSQMITNRYGSLRFGSPGLEMQRKKITKLNLDGFSPKMRKSSFTPVETPWGSKTSGISFEDNQFKDNRASLTDISLGEAEARKSNPFNRKEKDIELKRNQVKFDEAKNEKKNNPSFETQEMEKKRKKFEAIEAELKKRKILNIDNENELKKRKGGTFDHLRSARKKGVDLPEGDELKKKKKKFEEVETEYEKKKNQFNEVELDLSRKKASFEELSPTDPKKHQKFEELENLQERKKLLLPELEENNKKKGLLLDEIENGLKKNLTDLEHDETDKKRSNFEEIEKQKKERKTFEDLELDLKKEHKEFRDVTKEESKKSSFEEHQGGSKKRGSLNLEDSQKDKKKKGAFEEVEKERGSEEILRDHKEFHKSNHKQKESQSDDYDKTLNMGKDDYSEGAETILDYTKYKKQYREGNLKDDDFTDIPKIEKERVKKLLSEPEYTYFPPETYNLTFLVNYLQLFKSNKEPLVLFKFVLFSLQKLFNGALSLVDNDGRILFNGHQLVNFSEPDDELLLSLIDYKLPAWRDETYQEDINQFIYPYFQDGERLSTLIVHTKNGPRDHDESSYIELLSMLLKCIILETQKREVFKS
jgi:hypothetical protein